MDLTTGIILFVILFILIFIYVCLYPGYDLTRPREVKRFNIELAQIWVIFHPEKKPKELVVELMEIYSRSPEEWEELVIYILGEAPRRFAARLSVLEENERVIRLQQAISDHLQKKNEKKK